MIDTDPTDRLCAAAADLVTLANDDIDQRTAWSRRTTPTGDAALSVAADLLTLANDLRGAA